MHDESEICKGSVELLASKYPILKAELSITLESEKTLASNYPNGIVAFFKQKRFDLLQQIHKETIIGRHWIVAKQANIDAVSLKWIKDRTEWLKKMKLIKRFADPESYVNDEIQTFIKQILQLNEYDIMVVNVVKSKETHLTESEHALIEIYKGRSIKKGERGYNEFKHYAYEPNRIYVESNELGDFSKIKTRNKIKRIEKIIPLLTPSAQDWATSDLSKLIRAYNNEIDKK